MHTDFDMRKMWEKSALGATVNQPTSSTLHGPGGTCPETSHPSPVERGCEQTQLPARAAQGIRQRGEPQPTA